jgi:hypothetical protein
MPPCVALCRSLMMVLLLCDGLEPGWLSFGASGHGFVRCFSVST